MAKRKTTEQAIADFCKVHGNRYDYSKVDYRRAHSKVSIVCKEHGLFNQSPTSHLGGAGCPSCAGVAVLNTKKIIEQFKKVHGERYDYSKVNYINVDTDVVLICKKHGPFLQTPYSHKNGSNCRQCMIELNSQKRILSLPEVIRRFKKKHGNKYDYSKVSYSNPEQKVLIICPIHGEFLKTPRNHFTSGCNKCGNELIGFKARKKQEDFIVESKKIHGNRYDYSRVDYRGAYSKVSIICSKHGVFTQRPTNHSSGSGCPECGKNQVSEPMFRQILEDYVSRFGILQFPNVRPEWLRNPETNRPLELDCFNEEIGLAFEIQGRQHYEPIERWGGQKEFAKIIRRDNYKVTECRKQGVELFRIDIRPVRGKLPQIKRQYYENEIKKCLTKLPEEVKLKLLNAGVSKSPSTI